MKGKTNSLISDNTRVEKLNITLKTNQSDHSDLLRGGGIEITVTYLDRVIKDRWKGNIIVIDIPENTNYTVSVSDLEGYRTPSSYSSISNSGNSLPLTFQYDTEIVSVSLDSETGASLNGAIVTINGISSTWSGNIITKKIAYGTTYSVSVSEVNGLDTPSPINNITASQQSRLLNFLYTKPKYLVTAIKINDNISDPSSKITRIVDGGAIEAIRANSHRYHGWKSGNIMYLKQLNDSDSRKYVNGDIILVGEKEDVWMKLPQFYWKCVLSSNYEAEFYVAYGGKPDDSYNEWDGKDLIGAYEASYCSYGIRSVNGVEFATSDNHSGFNTLASDRGTGFSTIKWKHHCMMAWLFFIYYGSTNSQAICGSGPSQTNNNVSGLSCEFGMTDTTSINSEVAYVVNFWGLENWWGNKYELFGDVYQENGSLKVKEDGNFRVVGTHLSTTSGYTLHMKRSIYGDLLPAAIGGSGSTGYCDYFYLYPTELSIVYARSGHFGHSNYGITHLNMMDLSPSGSSDVTTRLTYYGDYQIVT